MVDLSKPYEEFLQETQPNTEVRNADTQISMAPNEHEQLLGYQNDYSFQD